MTFFLTIETAEDLAAAALSNARAAASTQVLQLIEAAAQEITGPVPEAEKASWQTKAEAARALIANTATAAQAAMIEAEARVTGEDALSLAGTIVTKADAYATLAATLAGLRRQAMQAINNATDKSQVQAALAQLDTALSSISTN